MSLALCAAIEEEAVIVTDGAVTVFNRAGVPRMVRNDHAKFEILAPGIALATTGVLAIGREVSGAARRVILDAADPFTDLSEMLSAQLPKWQGAYSGRYHATDVVLVGFDHVAGRCRMVNFVKANNHQAREPEYPAGGPVFGSIGVECGEIIAPRLAALASWEQVPEAFRGIVADVARQDPRVSANTFGCVIGEDYSCEIAAGSGVFGDWTSLGRTSVKQGTWTPVHSRAPNDGRKRRLRARHVRPTHLAEDCIAARSVADVAALSVADAAALHAYTFVSEWSDTVEVTPYSPTQIQRTSKTVRVPGVAFQPSTSSTSWYVDPSGAVGANGAVSVNGYAAIPIPAGAEVTAFRMRSKIALTGTVTVTLTKYTDTTGSGIGVGATTSAATGSSFATTEAGAFSTEVFTGSTYVLGVTIDATGAGTATDVLLAWVDVDYAAPYLDTSI